MVQRKSNPQLTPHTPHAGCSDRDFEQSSFPLLLIAYAENLTKLQTDVYHRYLVTLPPAHQEHILRYQFWQDAQRCLCGKLLLEHGLREVGRHNLTLQSIKYTQFQRPYFEHEQVDFNISHSGTLVVCAIAADIRIGIDIQEVRPIDINDFHDYFTSSEMYSIHHGSDPLLAFYDVWTKKEAVMKANGKGLSIPPKTIAIDSNVARVEDQQWFLTEVDFYDNYRCHLATNVKPPPLIPIKKYTF